MKWWAGALILWITGPCFGDSLSEALQSRRFQDALALADSLLENQPRDQKLWTARGVALGGLGRDQESLSSFEQALSFAPKFVPALKGAVEVSYRLRDARMAALLDRLLALDPQNGVAHAMAGVLAFEADNCAAAVSHFELAQAETIANEQAYSLYGVCLILLQRPMDAVPVFQRLLAAHPDSINMRFDLGYAQLQARRPTEALKTLQSLVAKPGAGDDVENLLASVEAAAGHPEAAMQHLRKAIEIAPNEEQNYVDLAALFIQNDSPISAGEVVEAGLKRAPNSARLHSIRGVVKAQSGTFEEAAAEFELANRLNPAQEYGAAGLGVLYTDANRADLASAVLRDRLKKSPGDPTLNYLLAETLLHEGAEPGAGNFAEAREALARAIRSKPDFAKAHTLLGKLLSGAEDYPKAVDELRLAVQYDPSDRRAWSQLAIALRHLGRGQEAAAAVANLRKLLVNELQPAAAPTRVRTSAGAEMR